MTHPAAWSVRGWLTCRVASSGERICAYRAQGFAARVWWRAGMGVFLLVLPVLGALAALSPGRIGTDVAVSLIFGLGCMGARSRSNADVIRRLNPSMEQGVLPVGAGGAADGPCVRRRRCGDAVQAAPPDRSRAGLLLPAGAVPAQDERVGPASAVTDRPGVTVRRHNHAVQLAGDPRAADPPPIAAVPPRDQAGRADQVARAGASDRPRIARTPQPPVEHATSG